MGLELGDLEEYGFNKSAKCGGYCAPRDMSTEQFKTSADLFIDRFADSLKNQYEVAMCHPVLAPHRPRVEFIWNVWPFTFIFSRKWRIILNTVTCEVLGTRFFSIFCELPWNILVGGCGTILLLLSLICFPCAFCIALIIQCCC